ncbi:MAG: aldo/keto reductase [Spirochaetales bacterium]|nr:aldo/keto reductase [Spirochaetales bacterium]
MDYRRLGRTDEKISMISLGTEYLIDLPEDHVIKVIRRALDAGINYFDLFWAKPEFRDIMGKAFERARRNVLLAAHLGSTHQDGQYKAVRNIEKSSLFFEDFLTRYRTNYADVLFLHNSDGREDYDEIMKPGGLKDLALDYKASGKAKYIGFSGHTVDTAMEAVKSGIIDVLMFPINIAGHAVPRKQELLRACMEHDVGLIAMKIFAGGKLLDKWNSMEIPGHLVGGKERKLERSGNLSPVAGIHYVLSQPAVTAVVPGCRDIPELERDLAYLGCSAGEKDYSAALKDIRQFEEGECVYCNHCLPCPQSIDIGPVIRSLETSNREAYAALTVPATECVECGECESRCPFGVEVIPKMQQAAALFG